MTDALYDRVVAAVGERYAIEGELGRGGMSVVYRARDRRLRRPVALKVLPPEIAFRSTTRTRFLREAETAAQLQHQNIVPIYEVDERDGLVWFAMAMVDGESLAARLQREPMPPADTVRAILAGVADALAYAHAHGVVHRDIKPDNILIEREGGRPLVTDFGIARAIDGDMGLTADGVTIGTPAYMSPEQARGERAVDGKSDIYSVGIVGYQMLAGELPFRAGNTPSMLMKHVSDRALPLRERRGGLPGELVTAVESAMQKDAAQRPDAARFREILLGTGEPSSRRERAPHEVTPAEQPNGRPSGLGSTSYGAPHGEPLPAAGPPKWLPPLGPQLPVPMNPMANGAGHGQWPVSPFQDPRVFGTKRAWRAWREARFLALPRDERIRIFRREATSTGVTLAVLAAVNVLFTPFFPWVIFPALGMVSKLARRWRILREDGVRPSDLLHEPKPEPSLAPKPSQLKALASGGVLDGAHGTVVRHAIEDGDAMLEIVGRLSKDDRAMIPDVEPTVKSLVERIVSLAQALQRIDADVGPEALASLDARIALVESEPATATDHERKLALLQRQRSTLRDLASRRDTLHAQMENASLVLQNLRLDMVKLRSAGLSSGEDLANVTQEARALSRELGYVLDGVEGVRKL